MYCGETFDFEHEGHNFRAFIEFEDNPEPPWRRDEGTGIVFAGHGAGKPAGAWVLHNGSRWQSTLYYDYAGTLKKARSDGWGLSACRQAALAERLGRKPTAREITAEAVRLDFERLRGWVNDEWCYVGVCVCLLDSEGSPVGDKYSAAVWGIESDDDDGIRDVARVLAQDALAAAAAEYMRLAEVLAATGKTDYQALQDLFAGM